MIRPWTVHRNEKRKTNVAYRLREGARDRATQKGMDFNISLDDIVVPTHCPILGVELTLDSLRTDSSPSLDRIDNSKGYIVGNVAVISQRANRIKNNGTADEHEAIAKWMRTNDV